MMELRSSLRVARLLPAILLAVFIATQAERFEHLHAVDDPVSECSQCSSYSGYASLSSSGFQWFFSAGGISPEPPLVHATLVAHYRLNARGPPTLS